MVRRLYLDLVTGSIFWRSVVPGLSGRRMSDANDIRKYFNGSS